MGSSSVAPRSTVPPPGAGTGGRARRGPGGTGPRMCWQPGAKVTRQDLARSQSAEPGPKRPGSSVRGLRLGVKRRRSGPRALMLPGKGPHNCECAL
ncbi:unnamed protein product [Lampetra planeri]